MSLSLYPDIASIFCVSHVVIDLSQLLLTLLPVRLFLFTNHETIVPYNFQKARQLEDNCLKQLKLAVTIVGESWAVEIVGLRLGVRSVSPRCGMSSVLTVGGCAGRE